MLRRVRRERAELDQGELWQQRTNSNNAAIVARSIQVMRWFALFAERDPDVAQLLESFAELLDPDVRPPLAAGGVWLVRPDGYTACVAKSGDAKVIAAYLETVGRAQSRGE